MSGAEGATVSDQKLRAGGLTACSHCTKSERRPNVGDDVTVAAWAAVVVGDDDVETEAAVVLDDAVVSEVEPSLQAAAVNTNRVRTSFARFTMEPSPDIAWPWLYPESCSVADGELGLAAWPPSRVPQFVPGACRSSWSPLSPSSPGPSLAECPGL